MTNAQVEVYRKQLVKKRELLTAFRSGRADRNKIVIEFSLQFFFQIHKRSISPLIAHCGRPKNLVFVSRLKMVIADIAHSNAMPRTAFFIFLLDLQRIMDSFSNIVYWNKHHVFDRESAILMSIGQPEGRIGYPTWIKEQRYSRVS